MPISHPKRLGFLAASALVVLLLDPAVACASNPMTDSPSVATQTPKATASTPVPAVQVPRPDHVVIVMFENESAAKIIGNPDAPYINSLAAGGANLTQSFAIGHPSQPNYVALFSGSTHGITDDSCPHTFKANNQAHQMLTKGYTFVSYAEDLPSAGSAVCSSGRYQRKHAPWTNFPNVPAADQQPYTAFPSDYNALPDVSWVIPNMCDDMHDCPIATGDAWLQSHLGAYATWAMSNNSLLIVDFDEDDYTENNQIATVFYGGMIKPGNYSQHVTHYSVLRTMEDMYGLGHLGGAASAKTIKGIWK